jgi:mycofactocin precursor
MSPTQHDAIDETATDEQTREDAPVELELVEEISIDGMCGVY